MQMCHSLRCKEIDMLTVDIDFSKQWGTPNLREFRQETINTEKGLFGTRVKILRG